MKSKLKNILILSSMVLSLISCANAANTSDTSEDTNTSTSTSDSDDYINYTKVSINSYSDFSSALASLSSLSEEKSFISYYKGIEKYLKSIYETKCNLSSGAVNEDTVGDNVINYYYYYWSCRSESYYYYYQILNGDSKFKTTLTSLLDAVELQYINALSYSTSVSRTPRGTVTTIDFSKMFIDRVDAYKSDGRPTIEFVTNYSNIISTYANKDVTEQNLKNTESIMYETYARVIYLRGCVDIFEIQYYLDTTNTEVYNEYVYLKDLFSSSYHAMISAFSEALSSSTQKDKLVEWIGGQDVADSYIDSAKTTDESLQAVEDEIDDLIEEYYSASSSDERKENYIDLVNKRNEYVQVYNDLNDTSYSNYEKYAFENVYGRDYTPSDASHITSKVEYYLKDEWESYTNSNASNLPDISVNEQDLWSCIDKVCEILPDAKDSENYMKFYGLYSFDYSDTKFDASFTASMFSPYLDDLSDSYLFLNATNTATDYLNVAHEFGHYYSNSIEGELKDENTKSKYTSYDLAELNSQALEFKMADYYDDLQSTGSAIKNYEYLNGLWSLFSGSALYELENFAYSSSTENLTVTNLDKKWSDLKAEYGLDTYNFSYDQVSHLFLQPGYYCSYVTSRLNSIELASSDDFATKYNEISKLGDSNYYLKVLEKEGLTSPFDASDTLYKKVEEVYKK